MDWTNIVNQLIELVKTTSTELWRIANAQVLAEIFAKQTWGWVLAGASVIGGIVNSIGLAKSDDNDLVSLWVIGLLICLGFAIGSAWLFIDAHKMVMSPEYYAIQQIILLAK